MSDRSRFPCSYDNDSASQSMRLGQSRYGKPRDLDALAAETPATAMPNRVALAKPADVAPVRPSRHFPYSILAIYSVGLASVAIVFVVEDHETRAMVMVCGFIAGCAVLGVLQAASDFMRGRS